MTREMGVEAAVELRGLRKSYGARVAVAGFDLTVPRGAVYGFLGPNGAGKTTALRVALGLLRADAGRVTVLGLDAWLDGPELRAEVGYVAGDLRLPLWMTGLDALRFVGGARGRDLTAAGRQLAEHLDLDLEVPVRAMSRGMRQKAGLILALAPDPRLLILDEPTTALDPIAQDRLFETLRERAARGATIWFSSHVLAEVQDLCDRVAILRAGELVADEALETLRRRAGRHVRVRFRDAAPEQLPPWLTRVERGRREVCAGMTADADVLLQWLGQHAVEDLEVGPPDLDRLFRAYYRDDAGGGRPTRAAEETT